MECLLTARRCSRLWRHRAVNKAKSLSSWSLVWEGRQNKQMNIQDGDNKEGCGGKARKEQEACVGTGFADCEQGRRQRVSRDEEEVRS